MTGTLDIKLGAGDIDLEGGTYKDIKLDCGMGSFALDGIVAENVKAHCGMRMVASPCAAVKRTIIIRCPAAWGISR